MATATAYTTSMASLGEWGLRYLCTTPGTPRTNGRAGSFIQINLREQTHARSYHSSTQHADPTTAGCTIATGPDRMPASVTNRPLIALRLY
jgi:hypothetical protein